MIPTLVIHGVPIECINKAAITYHVPAKLIISVLAVEGGEVGMASPNNNGTYDYGPMQINTIWLDKIKPYGYTKEMIQYDPCANVMVGAWILSMNIADASELWQGVGGYHSYTPYLNHTYRHKVSNYYQLIERYLSGAPSHATNTTAPAPIPNPPLVSHVSSDNTPNPNDKPISRSTLVTANSADTENKPQPTSKTESSTSKPAATLAAKANNENKATDTKKEKDEAENDEHSDYPPSFVPGSDYAPNTN